MDQESIEILTSLLRELNLRLNVLFALSIGCILWLTILTALIRNKK